MLNNNKIKIAMLDMSPQNKAILEFYFDRSGKSHYKVVNEASADALVIDYDQYGAKDHLTEILAERKIPILLVSIREQKIPFTVWIAKPLSADRLDKAANSLNELIVEIENEAKASEAKAKQQDASIEELTIDEDIEVLTDAHLEEDESLLNESIQEISNVEEKASSEKLLEIDEMTFEENTLEENKAEENSLVNAGLAIAGAGALVSATLTAEDNNNLPDLDDDLLDLNEVDTKQQFVEESLSVVEDSLLVVEDSIPLVEDSLPIVEDSIPVLTDELNENSSIESEEDEVDFLLDSLLSEENESSENPVEELDDDIFVDNLFESNDIEVVKPELTGSVDEIELEDNAGENLEIDVLKSVDSELEDNIDLQKSREINVEETHLIDNDKTALVVDEDFTMHDDQDPSTEDIYADTLEVNYAEVKSDNEQDKPESLDSLSIESKELDLNIDASTSVNEDDTTSGLDETFDDDILDFDFKSQEISDEVKEPSLEADDDFELTLLEDVETKVETKVEAELESDSLNDSVDNDLDNLLNEVSNESIDSNLTKEEEISHTEATIAAIEDLERSDLEDNNSDDSDEDLADTDLQSLLNEVREEADKTSMGITGADNAYEQTEAEKRWMQLCGNENAISSQKEITKITFDANKHLLSIVLKHIKSPKEEEQLFRLKYKDLIVVIDHQSSKVYCNTSLLSDEYSFVCFNEIDPEQVKVHDLDYSEVRLYRSKIEKNPQRTHSFESFIWTTSLLTSRGRLPEKTNVTKNIGLKTWPNLTRLEMIPNAMNVAAVFAKHPGTLLEVSNWLNIQQRYVFAFYNAALSLDMIELDSSKVKKSGFSFGKKDTGKKSEERGFFGRLLKRLKS